MGAVERGGRGARRERLASGERPPRRCAENAQRIFRARAKNAPRACPNFAHTRAHAHAQKRILFLLFFLLGVAVCAAVCVVLCVVWCVVDTTQGVGI